MIDVSRNVAFASCIDEDIGVEFHSVVMLVLWIIGILLGSLLVLLEIDYFADVFHDKCALLNELSCAQSTSFGPSIEDFDFCIFMMLESSVLASFAKDAIIKTFVQSCLVQTSGFTIVLVFDLALAFWNIFTFHNQA